MLIRIDVTFTLIIDLSFHWPASYLSEHLYCKFAPWFHDHVEMHLAEILIFFRTFINIIIIISCNNFRNLNSTQLNSSIFFFFRFSFIFNLAATHFDDLWTIFGRSLADLLWQQVKNLSRLLRSGVYYYNNGWLRCSPVADCCTIRARG